MSSSSSRRQSVTFVDDPELQVQRSSSTKLLASIASSGRPSPFQQMADNQQPDPHPFSSSSLSAVEQKSHPQHPSDSQISIWPWRRHIRRPARKSESSLNLSCQEKRELTQPELSVCNKDAPVATPRTGQQPAHLPHTLKMGQHPAQHPPNLTEGLRRPSSNAQCPQELTRPSSQTQAAAVEWGSVQQQPMPGAQHVQADEGRPHPELRFTGLTEKRPGVKTRNCWLHPEQAAVEDTVQQLPTPFQRASSKQVDGSLDGADAPRVAWQARQLRAPPKKSTSFSVSSPLSPGRPLSDDGVQVDAVLPMLPEDQTPSVLPAKPMLGRSSAFPSRHLNGSSFTGHQSVTDAAKNARRSTPRLARVMSWKVTKAASLSNQGLGPVEAEAGPLMCQPSSASQAFTYYEPFSGQSSLDPSFSDNTASQSFMMSGFSQESLSISNASLGPQVRSHPFSSSSITSGRPSFTGSLPQGPTSN